MRAVHPRCGSTDPTHLARGCRDCKAIYNHSTRRESVRRERMPCFSCGIVRDNSMGISVYTYPLMRTVYRNGRKSSVYLAGITICDRCLVQHTTPSPSYMRANGLTERRWPSRKAA